MYADTVAGFARGQFIGLVGLIASAVVASLLLRQWRYWGRPVPVGVARSTTLAENSAATLIEAKVAIDKAWLGVIDWGQDWAQQEELLRNCKRLGEIGMDLTIRHTRLRVTFGLGDDATASFGEAVDSSEKVYFALQNIHGQSDGSALGGRQAEQQARKNFEANRKKIDSERERFLAASARFEAAVGRIGRNSEAST